MPRFFFLFFCILSLPFANPSGAFVVQGDIRIQSPKEGHLVVASDSDIAILHWDQFNIKEGEITTFYLPHDQAVAVNRDIGGLPSHILGDLQSNGSIVLINPTGIHISEQGTILAKDFLATTLEVDENLLAKKCGDHDYCSFEGGDGGIKNEGSITTFGGDVVLLSNAVTNKGSIEAKKGSIFIGAAPELLLYRSGNQRIVIRPDVNHNSRIVNEGRILGENIELTTCDNPFTCAINLGGRIYSHDEGSSKMGNIRITTGGDLSFDGYTYGYMDAAASNILFTSNAKIDASHDTAPGTIDVYSSSKIYVSEGAFLSTEARVQGDGGNINLIADVAVVQGGFCKTRGGRDGGNGGSIEISGKQYVAWPGSFSRKAHHPNFSPGKFIIDPESDITISYQEDYNYNILENSWSPTFDTMNVNVDSLIKELKNGPVVISTTYPVGPKGQGSIRVVNDVKMQYSSPYDFTLQCFGKGGIQIDGLIHNEGKGAITCYNQNSGVHIANALKSGGNISIGLKDSPIHGSIVLASENNSTAIECFGSGAIELHAQEEISITSSKAGSALIATNQGDITLASGKAVNLVSEGGQDALIKSQQGSIHFKGHERRAHLMVHAKQGVASCTTFGPKGSLYLHHLEDMRLKASSGSAHLQTHQGDWIADDIAGSLLIEAEKAKASINIGGQANSKIGGNLLLQAGDADASITTFEDANWSFGGSAFIHGDNASAFIHGDKTTTISTSDSLVIGASKPMGAGIDAETLMVFSHGDVLMSEGSFLGQNTVDLALSIDGELRMGSDEKDQNSSHITAGAIEIQSHGPLNMHDSSSITALDSSLKIASGGCIDLRDNSSVHAQSGNIDIKSLTSHIYLHDKAEIVSALGNIDMIAKHSIFVLDQAKVKSHGPLGTNLVCDFGKRLGKGKFILTRDAKINTAHAPLNIFSANQVLNRIDGTLNDVNYYPTPLYFTNNEERWGINYLDYQSPQPLNIEPLTDAFPAIKLLDLPEPSPYNMFYQAQALIPVGQQLLSNTQVMAQVIDFIAPFRSELFRDLHNYDAFFAANTTFYIDSSKKLTIDGHVMDKHFFCPKFTIHYIDLVTPYPSNLPKTREKTVQKL